MQHLAAVRLGGLIVLSMVTLSCRDLSSMQNEFFDVGGPEDAATATDVPTADQPSAMDSTVVDVSTSVDVPEVDMPSTLDASTDAEPEDSGPDGAVLDTGPTDTGVDTGPMDTGVDAHTDAGVDARTDAGVDAHTDTGVDVRPVDAGNACQVAGGMCVALVPGSCPAPATIGSSTTYSCGTGLGVECCLPPDAGASPDAGSARPVCMNDGTSTEGWYRPDGTLLCLQMCATQPPPACQRIGTTAQGWYTGSGHGCPPDSELIVHDATCM